MRHLPLKHTDAGASSKSFLCAALPQHDTYNQDDAVASGANRTPAGAVLDAALPRGDNGRSNLRGAAAIIVAGEHPDLEGVERRDAIEDWRRYLLRWVGGEERAKPVGWVKAETAELLARYFDVEAEALTRPVPTEDERRLRKVERLQQQIRRLQGEP